VLLGQPKALRDRLLHPRDGRIAYVMGPTSRLYEERGVVDQMPKLLIAQSVLTMIEEKGKTRLEVEECDVLSICCETFAEDEEEGWIQFYSDFKLFLVVALVDPDLHLLAKRMFSGFLTSTFSASITDETCEPLAKAIRMIYKETRERAVIEPDELLMYLRSVSEMGEIQDKFVKDTMEYFRTNFFEDFMKSNLKTFVS
jgi:hypothetical protein